MVITLPTDSFTSHTQRYCQELYNCPEPPSTQSGDSCYMLVPENHSAKKISFVNVYCIENLDSWIFVHYVQTKRNLSLFRKKVFMSFDSIKAAEKKTTEYNVRSSMANVLILLRMMQWLGFCTCASNLLLTYWKSSSYWKFSILKKICSLFNALYL